MAASVDASAFPCPWCGAFVDAGALTCASCTRSLIVSGKFRITGLLGKPRTTAHGGVYRAVRASDKHGVAVKILGAPADDTGWKAWELFEQSCLVLQKMKHPGLPKVHAFERTDAGHLVLVRELFDGPTLEQRISRGGERFRPRKIRELLEELLELLEYLHGFVPPVVHRDIKPANIMFRGEKSWKPVLVDFDTVLRPASERTGLTVVGTPGYAAPEQFAAEATPASDVYGVGATLLFAATHTDPDALPRKEGRFDVEPLLDGLDARMRAVLLRMVEPDAVHRFRTAGEALAELRASDKGAAKRCAASRATPPAARPPAEARPAPPASNDALPTASTPARAGARGRTRWLALLVVGGITAGIELTAKHVRAPPATSPAAPVAKAASKGDRDQAACERGDAAACFSLGHRRDEGGDGVPASPAGALALYERACTLGSAPGCNNAGVAYAKGLGVAKDFGRARGLYETSCGKKNMLACRNLAGLLERGEGGPVDHVGALALYERACDQDDGAGCNAAAWKYEAGEGTDKDEKRAARNYGLACDHGYLWGCRNMGLAYRDAIGVERDDRRAFALFKKTCEGAELDGCALLGSFYEEGRGTSKNLDEAARLYRKSCDGNVARGCNLLGLLYAEGRGVSQDRPRAAKLLDKACQANSSIACSNLGDAYASGAGVPKDAARAADLYEKGCKGGEPRPCRLLAGCYDRGDGVARDDRKALETWLRACELGSDAACATAEARLAGRPAGVADVLSAACERKHAWSCTALARLRGASATR